MTDAGKGDTYRPVNKAKYDAEYDRIFKVSVVRSKGKKRKKAVRHL